MSFLCSIFGHKPQQNVHSGAEYMRVTLGPVDGIKRVHCKLTAHCARCEKLYTTGRIHLHENDDGTYSFPKEWSY